jgi:hypothetical protein
MSDPDHLLLVTEFMSRGTLKEWLYGHIPGGRKPWRKLSERLRMALQVRSQPRVLMDLFINDKSMSHSAAVRTPLSPSMELTRAAASRSLPLLIMISLLSCPFPFFLVCLSELHRVACICQHRGQRYSGKFMLRDRMQQASRQQKPWPGLCAGVTRHGGTGELRPSHCPQRSEDVKRFH